MIREFAGRVVGLVRSLMTTAMLVAVSTVGATAQIQVTEEAAARSVILSLFTINSMMEQQGATLEGGKPPMTTFRAFFTPALIEEIAARDGGFRPLVGAHEGTVDDYELRMAADQPPGGTVLEAAVKSGGTVRLISFAISQQNGRPLIARIWGDGWSFGDADDEAARAVHDEPAQPPSEEEQLALAAADEGGAATGNTASEATFALPMQDTFDGNALGSNGAWSARHRTNSLSRTVSSI